jgi:hypothetical protein
MFMYDILYSYHNCGYYPSSRLLFKIQHFGDWSLSRLHVVSNKLGRRQTPPEDGDTPVSETLYFQSMANDA